MDKAEALLEAALAVLNAYDPVAGLTAPLHDAMLALRELAAPELAEAERQAQGAISTARRVRSLPKSALESDGGDYLDMFE